MSNKTKLLECQRIWNGVSKYNIIRAPFFGQRHTGSNGSLPTCFHGIFNFGWIVSCWFLLLKLEGHKKHNLHFFITAMLWGTNPKFCKIYMWCLLPKTPCVKKLNCKLTHKHNHQYVLLIFTDWFGLIFLRSGYYAGAVFRFHIFIGKTFPQVDIPVRHITWPT